MADSVNKPMSMRLFIAVNFNNDTRQKLQSLKENLRERSSGGNFTLPENLHLTLAFLGECGVKETAAAKEAIEGLSFKPFPLSIDRVGKFRRVKGDTWWAGGTSSKALSDLHNSLTTALNERGFVLDRRKYRPHITLGREVVTGQAPHRVEAFGEVVSAIDLMSSQRINGKLTYSVVHSKRAFS